VRGRWIKSTKVQNRVLIHTFTDCTVSFGDEILFRPEWGVFDLACGTSVSSVFGNAADRGAYLSYQSEIGNAPEQARKPKTNFQPAHRRLNFLYAQVREAREKGVGACDQVALALAETLKSYPEDWLLALEVLELERAWSQAIEGTALARERLQSLRKKSQVLEDLIRRGLEIL
jgi:phenylalanine-4-hydroxylase